MAKLLQALNLFNILLLLHVYKNVIYNQMNRIAFLIAKVTLENVFSHNVGYRPNFINCIALT